MDKKKRTINTYDSAAVGFAEKFQRIGSRASDIKRAITVVNKPNPKVLEIGCGDGRDAKEIYKWTDDYLGIDLSESMLRLASQNLPGARFALADMENFPFPGGLDIIFAFASLLHVPLHKFQEILARGYDALNSGGVFVISVKHGRYKEDDVKDEFGVRTFYYYTPSLLRDLADPRFTVVHEELPQKGEQTWLEMILQK
ncbi:MAG: class I SAM-dependent methyltransferase [Candidatus Doudnabacteria bacterium]|nr:class I SAM-dependent methyltransferase [Candidatus Doudnabacteria bacterium]